MSESKQRFCDDCKKLIGYGENRKICKACKKACCTNCIKDHDTPLAMVKRRKRDR